MRNIVVLGAGFGGYNTIKHLERLLMGRRRIQLTMVSDRTHFLFTPLLPNVAAADIDAHHIMLPIEPQLERTTALKQARVEHIDIEAGRLHGPQGPVEFDYLVASPGSVANFDGLADAPPHVQTIRSAQHAQIIRDSLATQFSIAAGSMDDALRRRALHFAFVGGGPMGVELASELHETLTQRIYPHVSDDLKALVQISVIDPHRRPLHHMSDPLGRIALEHFEASGIQWIHSRRVVGADATQLMLDDNTSLQTSKVFWCAGVRAPQWLAGVEGFETDARGRVLVQDTLQAKGHEHVFVMGDAARTEAPCPQNVQTASTQAETVAKNLVAVLSGRTPLPWTPSAPKHFISLGRSKAAAHIGQSAIQGRTALALSRVSYTAMLPSQLRKLNLVREWFSAKRDPPKGFLPM